MSGLPDLPRVLGSVRGPEPGPTLICVGGIHGNEPAGVLALERIVARIEADPRGLRGWFLALSGNRKALAADRRFLDHDLNRSWRPEHLAEVRAATGALDVEDGEMLEIDRELRRAFAESRGRVSVLDLHSTSGGGFPFVPLDDTLPNRRIGFEIPAPQVLGLEEEISGTLLSHVIAQGVAGVAFEAGQHQDPVSVDRAEAAVWITLESSGVLARGARGEVVEARAFLARETAGLPLVFEVRYRHPVDGSRFVMVPGYRSFQEVAAGELLAHSDGEAVRAPFGGRLLMPLYQKQGSDGFFMVRRVRTFWLAVSAALRRIHAHRIVHWLPGVRRHPTARGSFVVDRRIARLYALELFHLLGYRREHRTPEELVMAPRGLRS